MACQTGFDSRETKILILEPQALVASDIAEGFIQIRPDLRPVILHALPPHETGDEDETGFHIAIIAADLVSAPDSPALAWVRRVARHVVVLGEALTWQDEDADDGLVFLGWPISDQALAAVISRFISAA
ncbi:hypothetical protein [Oceaniglobus trochenteri]|uniref:hypothetical protein n=1 Tax=Oceaniglobus trochenteri TaxID=2763260 RepID=UPI001CFFDFDC|nr:hypothetical protein [Oceaniglobus trochenteri]